LGLLEAMQRLLKSLSSPALRPDPDMAQIAWTMARAGWSWGRAVLSALGRSPSDMQAGSPSAGLETWRRLEEWSEHAPEPAAGTPAAPPDRKAELRKQAMADAGVQAMLEVFPAEIRDIEEM